MKGQLRILGPIPGDDLYPAVGAVWMAVDEESLNRLVASLFDRCEQVLDAYGESTASTSLVIAGHHRGYGIHRAPGATQMTSN